MVENQEKAEKELFALYKETKDPEIKKEITMRYLYIEEPWQQSYTIFILPPCRWKMQ